MSGWGFAGLIEPDTERYRQSMDSVVQGCTTEAEADERICEVLSAIEDGLRDQEDDEQYIREQIERLRRDMNQHKRLALAGITRH